MKFWKMSGAGNDFVAFDDRDGRLEGALTPEFISRVCTRGLSVGADGVLILRPDPDLRFRMIYHNSDGGRAAMCGNGGRCAAVLAGRLGLVEEGLFEFGSDSGVHTAELVSSTSAKIWMTEPTLHYPRLDLNRAGRSFPVCMVDAGVPHAVVVTENLDDETFEAAAGLRSHPRAGPEGANVDLVRLEPDGTLTVRTYERGVEGETLACGTGALAAVFCLARRKESFALPATLRVRSGLTLKVGRDDHGWWLEGEARVVYEGGLVEP
ncbi:diaminopimelate epimerase [Candidatus Fermentibacteria bacterium]|nr:diaminopimelate epimerase [Candidatus Fermentibacteria bacterium]